MKFEDLLSRADAALSDLMPEGTLSIVAAIDSKLAYPKNLIKVLLQLRPADVLLDNAATRNQLLLMLSPQEAKDLATVLNWAQKGDVYSFLVTNKFKRAQDRDALFGFFNVEIPVTEVKELIPSVVDVSPVFALFPHQARALRKVERYLAQEPRRALLHMPTGSGKTRTAMNVVANYLREKDKGVVVWLAHSEELCEQAWDEFRKAWGALGIRNVPLIRYWGPYEEDLRNVQDGVIIAGLKKAYSRLLNDDGQFRALSTRDPLVVMDEAHQAIAPTYQFIIDQLSRPMSAAQLLGLSATPGRTWNEPNADRKLSEFFATRKVTLKVDGYDNPVSYLINQGYLAEPKFSQIEITANVALTSEEQDRIRETFELPNSVLDRLGDNDRSAAHHRVPRRRPEHWYQGRLSPPILLDSAIV